jgi:hypothetical protein
MACLVISSKILAMSWTAIRSLLCFLASESAKCPLAPLTSTTGASPRAPNRRNRCRRKHQIQASLSSPSLQLHIEQLARGPARGHRIWTQWCYLRERTPVKYHYPQLKVCEMVDLTVSFGSSEPGHFSKAGASCVELAASI